MSTIQRQLQVVRVGTIGVVLLAAASRIHRVAGAQAQPPVVVPRRSICATVPACPWGHPAHRKLGPRTKPVAPARASFGAPARAAARARPRAAGAKPRPVPLIIRPSLAPRANGSVITRVFPPPPAVTGITITAL